MMNNRNSMGSNESKEPLLSGSLDPSIQPKNKNNLLKRRRYANSSPSLRIKIPEQPPVLLPPPEPILSLENKFSFRNVFIYLGLYFTFGTLCFFLVRNELKGKKTNGVLDAMYFCVVTMTTVGYGDLVPNSIRSKLLSCVFVFSGMCIVGSILSKAADYIAEKEEILMVKMIHLREKTGSSEILKEVESNKAQYKFFTTMASLLILIIVGIFVLHTVEELDFINAFYCVCATITTLGYGDASFSTIGGRLFAVFWILISTICLGQFFLYIAELQTEKRQRILNKWALSRKLTTSDLEAADLDKDNVVSAAEFIVYKLKEMGKICSEDISVVMEIFEKLDVDHSGTLTKADLVEREACQDKNRSDKQ